MKQSLLMTATDKISPVTAKVSESQEKLQKQLQETRKAANQNNKALSDVSAYEKQSAATAKAERSVKSLEKQYHAHAKAIKSTSKPTAKQVSDLAKLEQKLEDAKAALTDKQKALKATGDSLKKAGVNTKDLASEQARLVANTAKLNSSVREQRQALSVMGSAQNDAIKRAEKYKKEIREATVANRKLIASQRESAKASREQFASNVKNGVAAGATVAAGGLTAGTIVAATDETARTHFNNAAVNMSASDKTSFDAQLRAFLGTKQGAGYSTQEGYKAAERLAKTGMTDPAKMLEAIKYQAQVLQTTDRNELSSEDVSRRHTEFMRQGMSAKDAAAQIALIDRNNTEGDVNTVAENTAHAMGFARSAGISTDVPLAIANALMMSGQSGGDVESLMINLSEGMNEKSKGFKESAALLGVSPNQLQASIKADTLGFIGTELPKLLANVKPDNQNKVIEGLFKNADLRDSIVNGQFATAANQVTDSQGNAATLAANAANVQNTTQAQWDTTANKLLLTIATTTQPLLDSVNNGLSGVRDGLDAFDGFYDELGNTEKGLVAASAAAVGVVAALGTLKAASALAGKTISFITGKGKSKRSLVASGCCGSGGMDLPDRKTASTSAGRSVAKSGALVAGAKLAAKGAARLVPFLGTALLAFDAINFISEQVTGEGVIDNVKGLIKGDPDKAMSKEKLPTTEDFDKKAQEVLKQEQQTTITHNINITGMVEGLTETGEQQLIAKVTDALSQDSSDSTYQREVY